MADKPRSRVQITDFPGLTSNADPRDLPSGSAMEQTNAQSVVYGALIVRPGYLFVSFDVEPVADPPPESASTPANFGFGPISSAPI